MPAMGLVDAGFLMVESREHPMHVGGLQLFTLPKGADGAYVREHLHRPMMESPVSERFRMRPMEPVGSLGNVRWAVDAEVDIDHHFRRSAVPSPGRLRELFELTSRWQGALLDRHRPLWECHLVEGLQDNQVAVFTKVHHALVDGVSAVQLMQRSCTPDPDKMDCRPTWGEQESSREPTSRTTVPSVGGVVRSGVDAVRALAMIGPRAARLGMRAVRDDGYKIPFDAPRTILNERVGGARRFVAQSWSMERFRAVGKNAEVSFNDVVLAVCGGALRLYLQELDALPGKSLTAMVPVNLRDDLEIVGGNHIGAIIAALGTDIQDPAKRIAAVHDSTRAAKDAMRSLSASQVMLLSGFNVAGLGLTTLPGYGRFGAPPFNVIISNVPGPRKQMYFNGAHLRGTYPASIPVDGVAMNITLVTYDDAVDFGITACRASAPSVQRMIHHMETALADLEEATA